MNPYISRCKRKSRDFVELKIKSSGGMFDLFDNVMKENFRINDDEYDYLCENMNDDEMDIITKEYLSYKDKRECLRIIEKYLCCYIILNN